MVTGQVELQLIVNEVASLTGEDHINKLDAFCLTVVRQILDGSDNLSVKWNSLGSAWIPTE